MKAKTHLNFFCKNSLKIYLKLLKIYLLSSFLFPYKKTDGMSKLISSTKYPEIHKYSVKNILEIVPSI